MLTSTSTSPRPRRAANRVFKRVFGLGATLLLLVAGIAGSAAVLHAAPATAPGAHGDGHPHAGHCQDCPHAGGDKAAVPHRAMMHHQAMAMHNAHGGMAALHAHLAPLIHALDLTEAQQAHLQEIHERLAAAHAGGEDRRAHHQEALMQHLASGTLQVTEVQNVVDDHLGQLQELLYSIAEPMVDLFNSLDDEQRTTATAHLKAMHGD
jgi:hypothetical protein